MAILDVKDIKLGFWIGAGLFLFSIILGLLTYLKNKATDNG